VESQKHETDFAFLPILAIFSLSYLCRVIDMKNQWVEKYFLRHAWNARPFLPLQAREALPAFLPALLDFELAMVYWPTASCTYAFRLGS